MDKDVEFDLGVKEKLVVLPCNGKVVKQITFEAAHFEQNIVPQLDNLPIGCIIAVAETTADPIVKRRSKKSKRLGVLIQA